MRVYTHPKYSYVRVAEIPKNEIEKLDFALCKQPTETLGAYYKRQTRKPNILVNGGFFSMSNGVTCFNFRDENTTIMHYESYQWGMGIIGDKDIGFGNRDEKPWRDFISAYPVLIEHGKKVTITFAKEVNYNARRTMLGYNDTTVFIVCVENPGLAYVAMQDLMLNLGCTYAINLDGGGSTKMLHDGKSVTKNLTNRAVDNVVAVYLKEGVVTKNIDVTYQSYSKGKWLGKITNYNEFNGNGYSGVEGRPIQALKIKLSEGSIQYRAHTTDGKWWSWITDSVGNGAYSYSGVIGKNIDAIQIRLVGDIAEKYDVKYRVSTLGSSNYLSWINGGDDYAGVFGQPIDKVQIYVEKK